MEKIIINGGTPLKGEVSICGAKNSVVGLIPAALLAEEGVCVLENVPHISDVSVMLSIIETLGAKVRYIDKNTVEIDSREVAPKAVPHEMASQLRASYYLIGALLGRFNTANVAYPGGCSFEDDRPIDLHLKSFESLGATVIVEDDPHVVRSAKNAHSHDKIIKADANDLKGNSIYMTTVSVGATINAMLAAVKARGLTIIDNAAKEPHIVDIANFLNKMGARIMGAGTDSIKIQGVEKLCGCTYPVIPDQIEAGTYMAAVVATGGRALIKNVTPKHLESIIQALKKCGATVEEFSDSLIISREQPLTGCNIATNPHPGFPTDMQPQLTALLTLAEGTSTVEEKVWSKRFRYVPELVKMGANIIIDDTGKIATINGVKQLNGETVGATDLRAGAALVIAGLCAQGKTTVENIEYIERGYDSIVEKLRAMGADIERVDN